VQLNDFSQALMGDLFPPRSAESGKRGTSTCLLLASIVAARYGRGLAVTFTGRWILLIMSFVPHCPVRFGVYGLEAFETVGASHIEIDRLLLMSACSAPCSSHLGREWGNSIDVDAAGESGGAVAVSAVLSGQVE